MSVVSRFEAICHAATGNEYNSKMKARSVEGRGRINIRQMVPVMGTMKSQDFPKEEET